MSKIKDEHLLELVHRTREKDEEAFNELYSYYYPKAVRYGEKELYSGLDKAYVPDIVNKKFMDIWGANTSKEPTIKQLKKDEEFENWLFKSIKNAILDRARAEYGTELDEETGKRKIKQRQVSTFTDLSNEDMDYNPSAETSYSVNDISWELDEEFNLDDDRFSDEDKTFFDRRDELVRELVANLSDKEREVLSMYFFSQNEDGSKLTLSDVGNRLGGLSTSTVNSRLDKAKGTLKGIVEKYQKENNVKLYNFTPALLWYLIRTSKNSKDIIPETLSGCPYIVAYKGTELASEDKLIQDELQSTNAQKASKTLENSLSGDIENNAQESINDNENVISNETSISEETPSNSSTSSDVLNDNNINSATGVTSSTAGVSTATKVAIGVAVAVAVGGGGYLAINSTNSSSNTSSLASSVIEGDTPSAMPEESTTPEPTIVPTAEVELTYAIPDEISLELPEGWSINIEYNVRSNGDTQGTVSDGKGGTATFSVWWATQTTMMDEPLSEPVFGNNEYEYYSEEEYDGGVSYISKGYSLPYIVNVKNMDTTSDEFVSMMSSIKYEPLLEGKTLYDLNVRYAATQDSESYGKIPADSLVFVYSIWEQDNGDVWYRIDTSGYEGLTGDVTSGYVCAKQDGTEYIVKN
jgi:RNA polymerase sigma factor (sigma-70 family)